MQISLFKGRGLWIAHLLFLFSCQVKVSESASRHVWGETTRERGALESCAKGVDYPEIRDYLTELAGVIIAGNPLTFKGNLTPDKFCFKAVSVYGSDAYADPNDGTVGVDIKTVLNADNDAEIAAVLSHELAHIVLGHNHDELIETVSQISPDLLQNNTIQLASDAYQESLDTVSIKVEKYFDQYIEHVNLLRTVDQAELSNLAKIRLLYLLNKLDEFEENNPRPISVQKKEDFLRETVESADQLTLYQGEELQKAASVDLSYVFARIGKICHVLTRYWRGSEEKRIVLISSIREVDPEWGLTKREVEADEVGMELYARAGFDLKYYYRFPLNFQSQYVDEKECLDQINNGSKPIRGEDDHPLPCWRVYNLEITEIEDHHEELSSLYERDDVGFKNILDGQLQEIKFRYLRRAEL